MGERCWICEEHEPDGGLRMTEAGDLICRWVIPCARRIAERHNPPSSGPGIDPV
jgi:hypothetical protein